MTVYIDIKKFKEVKANLIKTKDIFLRVQDQEDNILQSPIYLQNLIINPQLKIICSCDAELTISIISKLKLQHQKIAYITLNMSNILKDFKQSNIDRYIPFKISLNNAEQSKQYILQAQLLYDNALYYQGQCQLSSTQVNLNRVKNRQSQIQYLPLAKGKCQTVNFFSFLDPHPKSKKFKFIQSKYDDIQQF